MSEMEAVVEILGGKRALGAEPRRESDFIPLVREGVPFRAFQKASKSLDLSLADLERALGLSARSLLRRKHGRRTCSARATRRSTGCGRRTRRSEARSRSRCSTPGSGPTP